MSHSYPQLGLDQQSSLVRRACRDFTSLSTLRLSKQLEYELNFATDLLKSVGPQTNVKHPFETVLEAELQFEFRAYCDFLHQVRLFAQRNQDMLAGKLVKIDQDVQGKIFGAAFSTVTADKNLAPSLFLGYRPKPKAKAKHVEPAEFDLPVREKRTSDKSILLSMSSINPNDTSPCIISSIVIDTQGLPA